MKENLTKKELCPCGRVRNRSKPNKYGVQKIKITDCEARICGKKMSLPPNREEFNALEKEVIELKELLKKK